MENKNSVVMFSVIFLTLGVFIGWLICSNKSATTTIPAGNHMMGNGQMMNNQGMGDAMDSMMAGLSGKSGDAFDKVFIDEMIMHHEGAVAMAQSALKNAKHDEIKDMANAIISAQTKEINQMKAWRLAWFGN